jgi:hypothetical protein
MLVNTTDNEAPVLTEEGETNIAYLKGQDGILLSANKDGVTESNVRIAQSKINQEGSFTISNLWYVTGKGDDTSLD